MVTIRDTRWKRNMGAIMNALHELKENQCRKLVLKSGARVEIERLPNDHDCRRFYLEWFNNVGVRTREKALRVKRMNLFSMELDKIHLGNHVRLFEAFSGIGTQAMALKRLGVNVEHIGFSEIDKYAIQSYLAIHGDVKNYGDITKMTEIPPCDIFTWSFPCTDLSKAGKQKGLSGTRSGLAYEVIRLLLTTCLYFIIQQR